MDATKWIEWGGRATASTLLVTIIVSGYLGVWTWGTNLRQMQAERDEWKTVALDALRAGEKLQVVTRGFGAAAPAAAPETPDAVRERIRGIDPEVHQDRPPEVQ